MIRASIQGWLRHFGFEISRVPRPASTTRRVSDTELAALDADIGRLATCGLDLGGWESRRIIRSYLTERRIGFYHELLDVAEARGVSLGKARVIDVGTCTGYLLRLITQRHPECAAWGTDTQTMFVNLARQLAPQATIIKADLLTEISSETYGVVFCTEVLEHILTSEESLPHLLRLCAPRGAVVLTVPNGRVDRTPAGAAFGAGSYSGHVNFWSPESWTYYVSRHAPGWHVSTGTMDSGYKLYAVLRHSG